MPRSRSPQNRPAQQTPPPANPPAPHATGPDWRIEAIQAARHVASKLITTGNTGILLVMVITVSIIARLSSIDLREVLKSIIENHILGLMGWIFFVVTLVVCYRVIKGLRRLHDRQIDQLANQQSAEIQRMVDDHRRELELWRHLPQEALADPAQAMLPSAHQPPRVPET